MSLQYELNAAIVPSVQERRRHKREDLCFKVRFEVLGEEDALHVLEGMRENAGPGRPHAEEWYIQNLSGGGLGLCGPTRALRGRSLKEGDLLKLEIRPPRTVQRVRCVVEVAWVELPLEPGIFRAGVTFVGVNPEDLSRLASQTP